MNQGKRGKEDVDFKKGNVRKKRERKRGGGTNPFRRRKKCRPGLVGITSLT